MYLSINSDLQSKILSCLQTVKRLSAAININPCALAQGWFRNVFYNYDLLTGTMGAEIIGCSEERHIQDITIENFNINGKRIKKAEDIPLLVKGSVSNLMIK